MPARFGKSRALTIKLEFYNVSSGLPRTFGPKAATAMMTTIIAEVIRPNTPPTPASRRPQSLTQQEESRAAPATFSAHRSARLLRRPQPQNPRDRFASVPA